MIEHTLVRQNTIFGDGVVTGDLAVNGGDLTSTATTFNLLNTTVTTLNIGGAATAIAIGAATGTLTLANPSVRFADGSGAAPSITFASATDTGIFRAGNQVAIAIAGGEKHTFTASTYYFLDNGARIALGIGSDVNLYRDAANTLALRSDANAQTFRAYTTFTDASNYERFAINTAAGSITLAAETAGTGTDDVYLVLAPAGAGTVVGSTAANGDLTLEGTSHATKTTSYVILQPTGGNVGIGVTGPGAKLEVYGATTPEIKITGGSSSYPGLRLSDTQTGGADWVVLSGYPSAGDFDIREAGVADRLVIKKTSGNVGIGTSAFGTSAATVLAIASGTAPSTGPADTVQFYSSDISAGHTEPSFFCEGTQVLATGQADSVSGTRVKMRINGTEVTLLAI